jgi:hypothetical protein
MSRYLDHINLLEKNIYNIYKTKCKTYDENKRYIPYIFEYYSAIHMTKLLEAPFYLYKDFSKQSKIYQNFPVQDKGIDIINDSLDIVGQAKYYSSKTHITYGKLSTFLATEKLVRKKLSFYLIRTDHSRLDNNIKSMINNKIIYDVPINNKDFLKDIEIIIHKHS